MKITIGRDFSPCSPEIKYVRPSEKHRAQKNLFGEAPVVAVNCTSVNKLIWISTVIVDYGYSVLKFDDRF